MPEHRAFSELSHYALDPAARDLLDLNYCLERLVVVLGAPGAGREPVQVGMVRADDADLRGELEQKLGRPVTPVQLNAWEVRRALGRLQGVSTPEQGITLHLSADRQLDFGPQAAAPALLDDLLSLAVQRGATDVHIEVFAEDVDLRFRIDGFLRQVTTPLSLENVRRVVSRLKVLCELDVLERRRAQEGHLSGVYRQGAEAHRVDFRVSVVPGPHGEDVAIRVLDPRRFHLDLGDLGMPPALLDRFRRLVGSPDGLILVAGPTLSGKTNTLYAAVSTLRARERKILTAEDPIEYEFEKVSQKAVTAEMGYGDYVRAFVRHNPDVLLVGEVRDADTAATVVQAATTGHLVLSSVHTRSAATAVTRLRTLGVLDDYIASTLVAVLGQRLVPRICQACRVEAAPAPELRRDYFGDAPVGPLWDGAGCAQCDGTGYRGLAGVFELLELDEAVAAEVERGASAQRIQAVAAERGLFQPLLEDALDKVARGVTTLEEVASRLLPAFRPAWRRGASAAVDAPSPPP